MASWGRIAQKLRVPAGTILGLVFLLLMHPSVRSLWIGGCITFLGSLVRIWSAGHIQKGKILATGGPYAYTRNPLYVGSFLMALGVLLAGQAYWLLIPFGIFFLGVYYPVMKREEQELLQGYGAAFLDYSRRVPFFIPRIIRGDGRSSAFSWSRVIANREHRTLLGLLLIEAFLIWRCF
jgi:protein-S-isoprenylcysteine O-methyltransferase Ste14